MKKIFKLEGGESVDLIDHVREILQTKDVSEIVVGTDSQNKRYNTCFVVTVVMKYYSRGAHCVYYKENIKKIRDRYTRLWGEVERSVEVAQFLEANNIKVNCVELDFNKKEMTGSNSMIKASNGYVIGMGFNCKAKPDSGLSAVKFSDNVCRR